MEVSVKSDESCSTQFLRRATEHALSRQRPVVISNLDHSKLDLLKAEDITAEKLCLQALCMEKYPSGPIIDVPVDVKMTMKDQEFCQSNKKIPRTPVPSKSLSDSDMAEFVSFSKAFTWENFQTRSKISYQIMLLCRPNWLNHALTGWSNWWTYYMRDSHVSLKRN